MQSDSLPRLSRVFGRFQSPAFMYGVDENCKQCKRILCEIVWGNYDFAFVCEVGKSCMHCNVLLGTCFYLWQRSPKRGVLGQKVYPPQIFARF